MLDPRIHHPRDAIIKVTSCAICGSDLHIYNGLIPEMHSGDIVGHETMGEVVEVGSENAALKVGDRVVVPYDFMQRMLFLSAWTLLRMRADEPGS
jgi:threonine dehydrogenase-like Zn-dependent dehydrogenase